MTAETETSMSSVTDYSGGRRSWPTTANGPLDAPETATGDVILNRTQAAAFENVLAAEAVGLAIPQDSVHLPQHYARFKIEPIRFIVENGLNFFQGNIVKYVLRHDAKNGIEDLRKARRYLDMFIKFQSGDPDWWKAVV